MHKRNTERWFVRRNSIFAVIYSLKYVVWLFWKEKIAQKWMFCVTWNRLFWFVLIATGELVATFSNYFFLFLADFTCFKLTASLSSPLQLLETKCNCFKPTQLVQADSQLFQPDNSYFNVFSTTWSRFWFFQADCDIFKLPQLFQACALLFVSSWL